MPTYTYSGLSSTSSFVEAEDPAVETGPEPSDSRPGGDSKLADFDRVVELLVRESENYNRKRNRLVTILAPTFVATSLLLFYSAYSLMVELRSLESNMHSTVSLGTPFDVAMLMLMSMGAAFIMVVTYSLSTISRDVRRQRRVVEELAELVRETAPLFTNSMSLLRRAELKIRLSNIGIYDSLKYR